MREIEIPRYIDAQPQFFWWELDEFSFAVAMMGVGVLTETLTQMLILVLIASIWIKRFKANNLEGALIHIVYAAGIIPLNKAYKDGMVKEFYQ